MGSSQLQRNDFWLTPLISLDFCLPERASRLTSLMDFKTINSHYTLDQVLHGAAGDTTGHPISTSTRRSAEPALSARLKMEGETPLEGLQILQRDLVALIDSRLANLDRLSGELDASIADFRRLLDRKRRNEQSRQSLRHAQQKQDGNSIVTVDGVAYAFTEEFYNAVIIVADEVDLDELEAARLCVSAQDDMNAVDATLPFRAILRFHNQRQCLLDCLRLVLRRSVDSDEGDDDAVEDYFQDLVRRIVTGKDAQPGERSAYWRKCINGLSEIESLIKKTQDHVQAVVMTGQSLDGSNGEALQAQRMFLTHQHEALAAIMCYLVRAHHVMPEDFRAFLSKAASTDAPLDINAHYAPILICGSAHFGADHATTEVAARDLHTLFAAGPAQLQWKSKHLQSAATVWWLVEYSSRFTDTTSHGPRSNTDEEDRKQLFFRCLSDKAFHFMLAIADLLKPEVWHDPAKAGLVQFLLDNSAPIPRDAVAPSPDFAQLTMQEFQAFAEGFVSNMPDILRRLKTEEDDKRRNLATASNEDGGYEMDLERFLLIVSFAYQDDPPSAADFWSDTESNLYGFLRWTSRRLPTPRVAAFCELLRALANEERAANHAHRFLMDDGAAALGRARKAYAVSWAQMFGELDVYANSIRSQLATAQTGNAAQDSVKDPDIIEPETPIMLEAYLRLAAHVIRNSPEAQGWVLRDQPFRLHEVLLQLAQSSAAPSVRACCFNVLAALLTDKTPDINDGLWVSVDNWISGGGSASLGATRSRIDRRPPSEKHYLQHIAANPEVATAFVNLLNALVAPPRGQTELALDALPFPEQLGVSHRHAGIDLYVDFVMGQVFTLTTPGAILLDDRMQSSVLRHACLTFAQLCLSSFNEDILVLANTTNVQIEDTMKTKSLATYARLHPFARTMEHLFNNNVILALFDSAQQNPDELETLDAHSPLVQATLKAVEVMNLAMQLQPTYFDIVRPVIKTKAAHRGSSVANPAISSFDEVILSHLDLIVFLANFVACRHIDLTMASLCLLQKVSSSRKFAGRAGADSSDRIGHRLIGKLRDVSDAIQIELRQVFEVDYRDIEIDEEPIKVVKAQAILALLNASLKASPNSPSIAHCLLGFECREHSVEVVPGSLFAEGRSVFHHITVAAVTLPSGTGSNHISWLESLKRGSTEVLTTLASSTLTSRLVLEELRSQDFLAAMLTGATTITQDSVWDNVPAQSSDVLLGTAALGIRDFIHGRENLFQFASLELKAVLEAGMFSVREKVIGALLGLMDIPNGLCEPTTPAFALFDFFELEVAAPMEATTKYLSDIDLSACTVDDGEGGVSFDLNTVRQLLVIKKRELWLSGAIKEHAEELQLNDEISAILASLQSQNHHRQIHQASLDAVEAWTDLAVAIITSGGISEANQPDIALDVLQTILPKFERSLEDNMDAAAQLAKLTLTLVRVISKVSDGAASVLQNNSQERLLQAFRTCLKAISDSETSLTLRDVCYRICCLVLSNTSRRSSPAKANETASLKTKQLLHLVRDTGDRVVRVISEDAFSGRGVTRVSALLFLDALLRLFASSKLSSSILRSLTKLNFLPVLIDTSISSISSTFNSTEIDLVMTLSYIHAALAMLLRVAQTQEGVQLILNSSFFSAVEESRLFSTDPDIGLDIDNPSALREFYRLLAAILRVIVAIVTKRGVGDGATLQTAMRFLADNRFSISAVFKRVIRLDETRKVAEPEAFEVASELERLMLVTGFLEVSSSAPSDHS